MQGRASISKEVVQGLLDYFSQELASLKCPMPGHTSMWAYVFERLADIISLDDRELNLVAEEFLRLWLSDEEVRNRVGLGFALKDMYVKKLRHLFWKHGITPELEYRICKLFYWVLSTEDLEKVVWALDLFKRAMCITREDLRNRAWQEVLDYIDGCSVDRLILHLDMLLQNVDPSDLGTYCILDLPF
jgi:hypothetical protein